MKLMDIYDRNKSVKLHAGIEGVGKVPIGRFQGKLLTQLQDKK